MIQFSLKSVTKYLNFSLTICVYCSKYTFSTQCLSSNMKGTIDGFIYRHVSRSVNWITFTSCIFTISITKYWTNNDEAAIDCSNQYPRIFRWKSAILHKARLCCYHGCRQLQFPQKTYVPRRSDIQVFINCRSQCKPFFQWGVWRGLLQEDALQKKVIYIHIYI